MAQEQAANDQEGHGKAPYQVVARRFRPQTFEELVGQDEVLQSLRVALSQERVAHAFVFAGSRGVGKTTSARILARCLNCEQGPTPTPCGACDACRSILDGSNPDVIEIDAASNRGVDEIRQLRESVSFATMRSRYRVVILDEAHMLTKEAFNALLKTLEEPPPRVVFVLATTEEHKLPETIRSRCQILRFRRVGEPDLQKRLRMIADKEGVAIADDVLAEIATSVRGGVRDAETQLERVLPLLREKGEAFDLQAYRALTSRIGTDAVVDVVAALIEGDAKAGLQFAHALGEHGTDEREALGEIVDVMRWLLLLKVDGADSVLVPVAGKLRERLVGLVDGVETARLDAMIGAGVLGRERLKRLDDRRAVLEIALVRMAQAGAMPTLTDLLAQLRSGAVPAPTAAPPPRSRDGGRGGASAPAAEPAPASPTPARVARPVAPPADSQELKARVLQRLSDRQMLKTAVELCRIDGPDAEDRVVLTLQSERKMFRDRLAAPAIEQEVKQVINDAVGRRVRTEFRLDGGGAGAGNAARPNQPPNQPPKPDIEPGERTRRVVARMRGRVVQINPNDRVEKKAAPPPPEQDPESPGHVDDGEFLDPGLPPEE